MLLKLKLLTEQELNNKKQEATLRSTKNGHDLATWKERNGGFEADCKNCTQKAIIYPEGRDIIYLEVAGAVFNKCGGAS